MSTANNSTKETITKSKTTTSKKKKKVELETAEQSTVDTATSAAVPVDATTAATAATANAIGTTVTPSGLVLQAPIPLEFTVEDVFLKKIPHNMASVEKIKKFDNGKNASVFQFFVCAGANRKDPNPQEWVVDLTNDKCTVYRGVHASPNCTISINEHHLLSMFWGITERRIHPDGTLLKHQNPQMAFLANRLRTEGEMGMAMRIHFLVNDNP